VGLWTGAVLVEAPAGAGLEAKLQALHASMGMDLCLPQHPCKSHTQQRSPTVLVIASSALRAQALIRQLPTFGRACRIHKLFAKHIKVGGLQSDSRLARRCTALCSRQRAVSSPGGGAGGVVAHTPVRTLTLTHPAPRHSEREREREREKETARDRGVPPDSRRTLRTVPSFINPTWTGEPCTSAHNSCSDTIRLTLPWPIHRIQHFGEHISLRSFHLK
jgi:hypothetical protein